MFGNSRLTVAGELIRLFASGPYHTCVNRSSKPYYQGYLTVFENVKFNYFFLFSWQLAIFFAVVWGASAVVFLFSDQFGIPHYAHPLTVSCFFLVFLINTLNICFRHCRFWLLRALVRSVRLCSLLLPSVKCFSFRIMLALRNLLNLYFDFVRRGTSSFGKFAVFYFVLSSIPVSAAEGRPWLQSKGGLKYGNW